MVENVNLGGLSLGRGEILYCGYSLWTSGIV